jgi:hypothetical protein
MQREGYYFQYVRNMLQINSGVDANGLMHFSETGQLSGISNTDWSWSPLIFDFNNDGQKVLFITSGCMRDYADMDLQNNFHNAGGTGKTGKDQYPPLRLPSRLFRNTGSARFAEELPWSREAVPEVSGAAIYADFDNDGKMDLLYSNLGSEPSLYRNETLEKNHYLKISLKGNAGNLNAFGTKVIVSHGNVRQVAELQPVRGYQSSQDARLHFGLGAGKEVSLKLIWPDGTVQELKQVKTNQHLTIIQGTGVKEQEAPKQWLYAVKKDSTLDAAAHKENPFIDFKYQYTIPYAVSAGGPAIAEGDINNDGHPDYYLGGAMDQAGVLLLSKGNKGFEKRTQAAFEKDRAFEDVASALFDMDGDGDLDLYVASGGVEHFEMDSFYQDRIYINDGKGNYSCTAGTLPSLRDCSKGAVAPGDYDQDGDLDLFVGGYTIAGKFGLHARSFLLRNDSQNGLVQFTDVTDRAGAELKYAGMVTSASWADWDKDGYPELFVGAEWNSVRLFSNNKGKLKDHSHHSGLGGHTGLWSAISIADMDGDGDLDILAGNAGMNLQLKASASFPLKVYMADINETGKPEPLVSHYIGEKEYPIYFRDEFLEQAYRFKSRYPTYREYAKADMDHLFEGMMMQPFASMQVNTMQSGIFINTNGSFRFQPFPEEVQRSRINAIKLVDQDKDGKKDILVAGNFEGYRMRYGKSQALTPLIIRWSGANDFTILGPAETGFFHWGYVKQIAASSDGSRIIFFNNNSKPVLYERN